MRSWLTAIVSEAISLHHRAVVLDHMVSERTLGRLDDVLRRPQAAAGRAHQETQLREHVERFFGLLG
jgi:hypothetical protein